MSIFVGDEKVMFELEFRDYEDVDGVPTDIGPLDISAATEITFYFKKPDGTVVSKTKTATEVTVPTGTDGKAQYLSETGFLNQAGSWQRNGFVEFAIGKHHSKIVSFTVKSPL